MSLLTQVYGLLTISMAIFVCGIALARNGEFGTLLAGGIGYLVMAVVVMVAAETSISLSILLGLYALWVLISGVFVGPIVTQIREGNGWRPLVLSVLSTAAVLAACTYMSIGMDDPSAWMGKLAGVTFIFLIVTVIGAFIGMGGRLWDVVTGIFGTILASCFLLGYSAILMNAHAAGDTSTRTAVKIAVQMWSAILWMLMEFAKIYSK